MHHLRLALLLALALPACTVPLDTPPGDGGPGACEQSGDRDGDGVPDLLEELLDTDRDFVSDADETDSDGDGRGDALEAGEMPCVSLPDRDADGVPDLRDTDGNGDGVPDATQWESDLDGDDVVDGLDTDTDGDAIANTVEQHGPEPIDTDGDGTVDALDLDSDGDTIADAHEAAGDPDADDVPSFRDLDADGDGIPDADEAGDADVATPPITCDDEIDVATGEPDDDELVDALDVDRDGDGVRDGDERDAGMDPCDPDSDDDGFGDLVEYARDDVECEDGTEDACGCAIDPDCGIPGDDYYVVLPYQAPSVVRELELSTLLRVADVLLLADTTGSMGRVLDHIQDTVAVPDTGLIDRIRDRVPSAWIGGGYHDDFPLGIYGSGDDRVFGIAIEMSPPERAAEVQAAFEALQIHVGGDWPESNSEALLQVATGRGGAWSMNGYFYTIPRLSEECEDGRWGAPCFRSNALPIVVHFSDACAHNGPPGEHASCGPYQGFTPAPATWDDAIAAMNARAMRYVGINAGESHCEDDPGPAESAPCFFMHRTAIATGTVDLDGRPLVYDMPQGTTSTEEFVDTVTAAIDNVATRIPFDVDTALRAERSPRPEIDPRAFVRDRRPGCRATPPIEPCWDAPEGIPHDRAVGEVTDEGFTDVIPGTTVRFQIELANDVHRGGPHPEVFVTWIDLRGDGVTVLDSRAVYVVVPAGNGPS
ncbi:MSCRAMM family adhesin SdrC [Sandaracinus amylolyticus]|uniref:MSCRAMM family adhesin SdrC n=1 Tax=Sandaracinus amylolyticus TaxID=927083 RepID=UPI001F3F4D07|nr:MSCRAMM family adhesin SdrC [Sandaracinus amylolyticus]UJR82765.1 Hypothetical protein I5071_48300 [Sandaracinus amylolyticus]